jgi:hypothetical protein
LFLSPEPCKQLGLSPRGLQRCGMDNLEVLGKRRSI